MLLNRNGSVKLCDFGVSGQLDRSIAKTNIGCQSYMAVRSVAPTRLLLDGSLTSLSRYTPARAHQGRISRSPFELHCII